jgi:hypothetical protein
MTKPTTHITIGDIEMQTDIVNSTNPLFQQHFEKMATAFKDGAPTASLSLEAGFTLNTGNYNNVKVSVGITIPALLENPDPAYELAKGWIDFKISELHSGLTGGK